MSEKEKLKKLYTAYVEYFVKFFEDNIDQFLMVLEDRSDFIEESLLPSTSRRILAVLLLLAYAVPKPFSGPLQAVINFLSENYNKNNVKRIARKFEKEAFDSKNLQNRKAIRKVLVKTAVNIFQSFEMQFANITTVHGESLAAIKILAENSVIRILICYLNSVVEDLINMDFMTKAVVNKRITATVIVRIALPTEKNVQTAELFIKAGTDPNTKNKDTNLYGFRRPFYTENYSTDENKNETNFNEYRYLIDQNNFEDIVHEVLEYINGKDPMLKDERIEECIISTANKILEEIQNANSKQKLRSPLQYQVRNAVNSFIGRIKELNDIHGILNSTQCLIVCGLGGIGKSDLIRHYIHQYKEEYKNTIWLDAEKHKGIRKQIKSIATELEIKIEQCGSARDLMCIIQDIFEVLNEKKTLVIFDNVTNLRNQKYLPPENFQNIKTIITSQIQEWGTKRKIILGVLEQNDAIDLVKQTLVDYSITEIKVDELNKFTRELGYLPLALQQALAYIINENKIYNSFLINDYLIKLEKLNLLDIQYPKGSNHPFPDYFHVVHENTLFRTLQLTLDRILEEDEGSLAIEILNVISYLPADGDFKNLIINYFKSPETALYTLKNYSLISEDSNHILHSHRLVLRYMRSNQINQNKYIEEALNLTSNSNYFDLVLKYAKEFLMDYYDKCLNKDYLFYKFIKNNYLENVEIILKLEPKNYIINYQNPEDGSTPLHICCKHNLLSIIKLLLEKGALANVRNSHGDFPLHLAIKYGFIHVVQELINYKNSFSEEIGLDIRSLYYAGRFNHIEIAELLLKNEIPNLDPTIENALLGAVEGGNESIVKLYIDHGANVNVVNEYGETAAYIAARMGFIKILKCLIEHHADLSIKTKDGASILHAAAQSQNMELLEFINKFSFNGSIPYHYTLMLNGIRLQK